MNNSVQAKNGFKTFLITLSVSLMLFSLLYYFVNSGAKFDIESGSVQGTNTQATPDANVNNQEVAAVTNTDTKEEKTVFSGMVKDKPVVPDRVVLAGATTAPGDPIITPTPQSTTPVPNTGSVEITYALILSSIILGLGTFAYLNGPRRHALASFEKEVLRSLDKE